MANLTWLTFTAVGCAPNLPMLVVADCVAGVPKFWCNSSVGAVTKQATQFALLDFVADFGAELEVVSAVVYGP